MTKETSQIDRRKTYSNYIGKASRRAVTVKIPVSTILNTCVSSSFYVTGF